MKTAVIALWIASIGAGLMAEDFRTKAEFVAGNTQEIKMKKLGNEGNYDAELHLVRSVFKGPGYHSKIKDGTPVHDIRGSAEYALECLELGGADRVRRAADIFDRLCSLQDVDPASRTYGIWSWTYEEPLSQMDPPDWNWADFIGVRLAHALRLHAGKLPADTVARTRVALGHAAESIIRRDVKASYTNIAIMGGVVTAAAGELLEQPRLLEYARRRFRAVRQSVEENGSFNEYNSPTYTAVAIEELDRLALLVDDPECREVGDFLWRHAWEIVAEHFHPATVQWAGPHARAYSDRLQRNTLRWLSDATGLDVGLGKEEKAVQVVPPRRCPATLVPRFRALPLSELTVVRQFCKGEKLNTVGTTWMNESACLASANYATTWVQQRPLIGYWKTPSGVAVLKMSVLLGGREFPGFRVYQKQEGRRVLTAWQPLSGTGYFHPSLNKVPGSRFDVADLRIRCELNSEGAVARALPDGRYVLSDGTRQAVIHPSTCTFNGDPILWSIGKTERGACIDGQLYCGASEIIDFTKAEMRAAVGLELAEDMASASAEPVGQRLREDGVLCSEWEGLLLESPSQSAAIE